MEPMLGPITVLERAPGGVSVTGASDLATAPRLDELEDVHGPLLLDLQGVTFIDSSGIAALVRLHRRCPHHEPALAAERVVDERAQRVALAEATADRGAHDGDPDRAGGEAREPAAPTHQASRST